MDEHVGLIRAFVNAFGHGAPPIVCSAPGRVNLVGEHIDYNGLPVLPMTIDRFVRIAFRASTDGRIRVTNTNPQFFSVEFQNSDPLSPSEAGCWENYCKAAVFGINRRYDIADRPGMDCLVDSTLPHSAGLSSSTALVVATALAYLQVAGRSVDGDGERAELAGVLAEAERFVGTQGGGMDQAAILLGDVGCACKIDFFPIRVERVPIFRTHTFVVCNSLVRAEKSGAAVHRYNEGPVSCRLIRALVEKRAQSEFGEDVELERLADLWFGPLCLTDSEVQALLRDTFPRARTTLAEASVILGLSEADIRRKWIGDLPEPTGGFKLQARARHQLTEYRRVEQCRDCFLADAPEAFGALMTESHASCAVDYGVSCTELDDLVGVAIRSGSIGSRLTGAGFGGCTINLVANDDIESFRNRVWSEFFAQRHLGGANSMDAILPVAPGGRADYIYL